MGKATGRDSRRHRTKAGTTLIASNRAARPHAPQTVEDKAVGDWRCNYCLDAYKNKSLKRLACHLAGIRGEGIAACNSVPDDVKTAMLAKAKDLLVKSSKKRPRDAGGLPPLPQPKRTQRQPTLSEAVAAQCNEQVRTGAANYCTWA